jgi:hypothetical protein
VTSKQSDLADRAERERQLEAALTADRQGRDRIRRLADREVPDAHGDQPTPNVGGRP